MLSAAVAGAALLAVGPRLARLGRRYDDTALAPIDRQADAPAADDALAGELGAWVAEGAGSGRALLPWSRPALPVPLAMARIPATEAAAVHRFAYRLAGYHQLDARGRMDGIRYRVGVQLRPLAWFLPRRADEPWDDAWLTEVDAARLAALARWRPRRPTLIVLADAAIACAGPVAAALGHTARHGDQPVRLLILDPAASSLQAVALPA